MAAELIKAPHERWTSGRECWEIDGRYWSCSGILSTDFRLNCQNVQEVVLKETCFRITR